MGFFKVNRKRYFILTAATIAGALVIAAMYYLTSVPASEPDQNLNNETANLRFFYSNPENSETDIVLKDIINDFNNSQKKIRIEGYPGVSVDKQLVSIMSGDTHDIGRNLWPNTIRWAQNGLLEPLTPLIQKDAYDVDDFLKTTLDMTKFNGTIYAMPVYVQTMALYYNIDMLKEAGFDRPPETISELKAITEKLTVTNESGDIKRIGFLPDYPWLDNVLWPIAFGADFYDTKNNEITTTSAEYIEAIEFQNWFYQKWGWDKISRFKLGFGSGEQEPFYTKKLAMEIGGDWVARDIKSYAPDLKYGICPVPYPDNRPDLKGVSMISADVLYIPAGSQHKQEAWDFLKFLVSKESLLKYAITVKCPVARKSVLMELKADGDKDLKLFSGLVMDMKTKSFTPMPITDEYLESLAEQTQLVFKQKKDAVQAMKAVKEKIDPLLKK